MADCDESAVLEVSSECKSISSRNESRDSITEISNYSTSLEGSVVASPSIESFSLLPENDSFDFGLDTKDLQVKVDNPQKHLDPFETYITFRITTRTTREEYSEREYSVRRRYSDFLWLRQKLVEAYPTHIVPPLPAKHTLLAQLDRYSRDFVICRMAMLHRYLNRVTSHPILSCNTNLKTFLTAKSTEFSSHRKADKGIFSRMSDSFHNITHVYMSRQHSSEFESVREHVTSLAEKLTSLENVGERVLKERKDYQIAYSHISPVLQRWASSEPGLRWILLDVARAADSCVMAHKANLLDTFQQDFSQAIKEYLMYIDAIKEALARRDSIHVEYEITVDEISKKRGEKDALMGGEHNSTGVSGFGIWKTPAEVREDKLEKLATTIPKLVKQAELNQDKMEIANENLRSDLQRWRYEKKEDLKKILLKMADHHVKYYQECLEAWEKLLPSTEGGTANDNVNMPTNSAANINNLSTLS
ncbi:sorting nexin-30-like isoform X1 [Lycorma delicatula]|uniref:sorting nexin-30-like isoform X1 n=1 Tax=Lycorma delicatula TaxID=130591 RepID=UPI003F519889